MKLQADTTFANRYQLEKLLGRGGFSEVWLAKDNWTHLRIAIKVYAPGQGMDANGLQEFCGELANVFDLNHTNLLKPTHVDTYNDMPYLIMAYCSQGSLASRIGQMTEEQVWKMIHDVASGLAYLHQRDVVHQDIKPDNILIDDYGNYLITDFGISTRARSTLRKSVVGGAASGGTTAYMGPERFSRQPAPTKASDIWSFGAMIYEVLETIVPFGEVGGGLQKGGAEIPFINAPVSDALKFTVYKMLSRETWDRPTAQTLIQWAQDPAKIQIDYRLLQEEEPPTPTPPPTPVEPVVQPNAERKTQRFGAAAPQSNQPTGAASQKTAPLSAKADVKTDAKADTDKPKRKIAPWIIVCIGLVVLLGAAIGFNTKLENEASENHQAVYVAFNSYFGNIKTTGIDDKDIENLRMAAWQLQQLEETEGNWHYRGEKYYYSKRTALITKMEAMRKTLTKIKQDAWSTTDTSYKNAHRRIKEINQIQNEYNL